MNNEELKKFANHFIDNMEKAGMWFASKPLTPEYSKWELTQDHILRDGEEVANLTWTGYPATMGMFFTVPRGQISDLITELAAAQAEIQQWRATSGQQQHLVICSANPNGPLGGPGCVCAVVPKWEANQLTALADKDVHSPAESLESDKKD